MPEQLHVVLVALEDDVLLLPNNAVAEAISYEALRPAEPAERRTGVIGSVPFDGALLPAVSFEALSGQAVPAANRRSRFTAINALGARELRRFALLSQGYPHLFALNRDALQPAALRPTDDPGLVLARVRIASREAVIPDLAAITRALLEQETSAAGALRGAAAQA